VVISAFIFYLYNIIINIILYVFRSLLCGNLCTVNIFKYSVISYWWTRLKK